MNENKSPRRSCALSKHHFYAFCAKCILAISCDSVCYVYSAPKNELLEEMHNNVIRVVRSPDNATRFRRKGGSTKVSGLSASFLLYIFQLQRWDVFLHKNWIFAVLENAKWSFVIIDWSSLNKINLIWLNPIILLQRFSTLN